MIELFDIARTVTKEPIRIDQYYELYAHNWNILTEYLHWSKNHALILMHPNYPYERDDASTSETSLFHQICSNTVNMLQKAQSRIPIILYVSSTNPNQCIRTAQDSRKAMLDTAHMLTEYGYESQHPVFFVTTHWKSPRPLESPLKQHLQRLEASGLTYAVVGGMYFHLDRNPYSNDTFYPVGPYNYSPISAMIEKDHQHRVEAPKNPQPLTLIAPDTSYSCLGIYADYLARYTNIRFRFGRGLTYPDTIPRPGDLKRLTRGYGYER